MTTGFLYPVLIVNVAAFVLNLATADHAFAALNATFIAFLLTRKVRRSK